MKSGLYEVRNSLLMRTPLLPFDESKSIDLDSLLKKPNVLLAIKVASPSLHAQIVRGKRDKSIKFSLLKYLKRMSTRPTPFSILAGVSMVRLDTQTQLVRKNEARTLSLPDMAVLIDVVQSLEKNKSVRGHLKWFTNPEVAVRAGKIWLERPLLPHNGTANGIKIPISTSSLRLLSLAVEGCGFAELRDRLSFEFQETIEKTEELLHHFCDMGLLLSDLRFSLDCSEELSIRLNSLSEIVGVAGLKHDLEEFLAILRRWDKNPEKSPCDFERAEQIASRLSTSKNKVRVDTAFDLSAHTLNHSVASEVEMAAQLLLSLSTSRFSDDLLFYRNAFRDKYQAKREIPLLELMSPTFGLGLPYAPHRYDIENRSRTDKLFDIASNAFKDRTSEVTITAKDLLSIRLWEPNSEDAPESLDLYFSLMSNSVVDLDKGHFSLVVGPRTGEIGAGRTLGRFASLLGQSALTELQAVVDLEKVSTSEINADVNYWPEHPKSANIGVAPALRKHSISLHCAPNDSSVNIPLSELTIGLEENRFYARWIRTGQKVNVYSNNMLTRTNTPDAINFLLNISTHGKPKVEPFDWGSISDRFAYLPRLRYGKTVFSLARWNLKSVQATCSKDFSEFCEALAVWRRDMKVPALIQIATEQYTDNRLLIDLTMKQDVELLQDLLQKQKHEQLFAFEYLDSTCCQDESGNKFNTEFVASLTLKEHVQRSQYKSEVCNQIVSKKDSLRVLGSDWLYLRLDCSARSHEELISSAQAKAQELVEKSMIFRWFYVRFSDKNDHLRLRFKVDQSQLYSHVLPSLAGWASELVDSGVCSAFSFQTYDREVERYGGAAVMDSIEELFCVDSVVVSDLLQIADREKLDRNIVGILSVNNLLECFIPTVQDRYRWLNSYNLNSKSEDAQLFRSLKPELVALFVGDDEQVTAPFAEVKEVLAEGKEAMLKISTRICELEKYGYLTQTMDVILYSVLHMHCIRMVGVDRPHEERLKSLLTRCLDMVLKYNKESVLALA